MVDELDGQQQQDPFFRQGVPLASPAQDRPEKYNTTFLTTNLLKERRRNQMIIAGAIAAAVGGVLLWVSLMPDAPTAPTKGPGQMQLAPGGVPAAAAVQPGAPSPPPAAAEPPASDTGESGPGGTGQTHFTLNPRSATR